MSLASAYCKGTNCHKGLSGRGERVLRICGRWYRVVLDVSRRNNLNDRALRYDRKTLNF